MNIMSEIAHTSHSSIKIFFHAFMPTSASLVAGFMIACGLSGTHLLIMAVNGQAQPVIVDDSHAYESYQNFLVQPLLRFTNNSGLNTVLATLLWGLFGWAVYSGITFVIKQGTDWRAARSQVRLVEGHLVHNSETKDVIKRTVWRLAISFASVIFTVLIHPLLQKCLQDDYQLITSQTAHEAIINILPTLGIWMLIAHGYTVLLRLYMMRTRILGEILY